MSTQEEYTLYPDQEYSEENDEVWYENGKRTSKNGRVLWRSLAGCLAADAAAATFPGSYCYGWAEAGPASYA